MKIPILFIVQKPSGWFDENQNFDQSSASLSGSPAGATAGATPSASTLLSGSARPVGIVERDAGTAVDAPGDLAGLRAVADEDMPRRADCNIGADRA